MNYLIHSGLLLAGCFVYYWFLLRTETHFKLNRWLLLVCIGASFALPIVTVPADWSLRSQIPTTQQPCDQAPALPLASSREATYAGQSETRENCIEREVSEQRVAIDDNSSSKEILEVAAVDWLRVARWIYIAGVLVFGLHFLMQISLLLYRMIKRPGYEFDGFRIIELNGHVAPYSFWNRIFLNPAAYDSATFQQIVDHERIHIRQRHTLDILLAELLVVIQWCNPFAWLYRWAMEHNLEFLTDAEMLRQGTDRVNYQMNLVRVSVPNLPQGLTSNYNQNFLKKRIQMMNVKQSTLRSGWKYLALMPFLLFSVLQFNAVAQTPAPPQKTEIETPGEVLTTQAAIEPSTAEPQQAQQSVANPNPRPHPQPSSVQIEVEHQVAEFSNDPDLRPDPVISIEMPTGVTDRKTWSATIDGNEVEIYLMVDFQDNHHMNTSLTFSRSELGALPTNSLGEFSAQRYAGTMTFRGVFDGDTGAGQFDFEPSDQFKAKLRTNGYDDYNWIEQLHFFIGDFQPGFLDYLSDEGYKPSKDKLLELMIFGYDKPSVKKILAMTGDNGFERPSLQKLIELKIFEVDEDYLGDLAAAGFANLTLQNAIEGRIHGLDSELISGLGRAGFDKLSFQQALEMAIHDVTPTYIADLRMAGYDLSPARVIEARIHGVDSGYAAELARAGFGNLDLRNVIEGRVHGLDADFVRKMAEIGYEDLDFDDLISLSIHGISAQFVQDYKDAGLELDIDEITSAAIHGLKPSDISEFGELGLNKLSFDDLVSAKIHGVTPNFVRSFEEFKFRDLSIDELISFRIHGVTAEFIRSNWERGDSPGDFIEMRIHGTGR
ncbi:MAG: M56 family metallopeptidase [Bacteroidota bacterium]